MPPALPILILTGAGGIGLSIARRLGASHHILLADFSTSALDRAATSLSNEGHTITSLETDVSSLASVVALFKRGQDLASSSGSRIASVVHAAGVSPAQASPERLWAVDLLGTTLVLDEALKIASPGMSVVAIASMAADLLQAPLSPSLTAHLMLAGTDKLMSHPELGGRFSQKGMEYGVAKRGNRLRVQALAKAFGEKGARVNSVSPGVISTAMSAAELEGEAGDLIKGLIDGSAAGRLGAPAEIANAVAWLCSVEAGFVTGTDLLVDGGATAAVDTMKAKALGE
ncbi:short-chain dehydrogenase/reductase SDR [Elsinoe ampelina]|uniref:Short-chain dehydrogenase/reductase SDR n=1 Tax=Elsinoe ampelina TaxID=302913 RepID=A0A6A6GRR5_9PEZI|nr:short-chain dehydrogenase/reductase SDR [Elsinoe ampelina]